MKGFFRWRVWGFAKQWQRIASVAVLFGFSLSLIPGVPNLGTQKASAAAISFEGSTSTAQAAGTGTIVLSKPAAAIASDVLIGVVGLAGMNTTVTPPAGWNTFTNNQTLYDDAGTPYAQIYVFWKIATGSEPSTYTFNVGANGNYAGGISLYRSVDNVTPIDASGGNNTNSPNSDTSPQATSINAVSTDTMLVTVFGAHNASVRTYTAPSGMNERIDQGSNNILTPDISIGLFDESLLTSGATGSRTGTLNGTGRWAALQFTLKPAAPTVHMMLFWDGAGSAPAGWSYVTAAEGYYLRGDSPANYGTTGGHATHTHDNPSSVSMSAPSATAGGLVGNNSANLAHTHNLPSSSVTSSASNEPAGYKLRLIRYNAGVPNTVPNGAIAVFDGDPGMPTDGHWTRLTAADNRVIKADSTVGNGPGSDTHTHTITWGSIGAAVSTNTPACSIGFCFNNNNPSAPTNHTHSLASSSTSATATQIPPYFQPVFGKVDQDTPTISLGITALFDGDPGGGWVTRSSPGGDYYHKFIRPGASFSLGAGADGHKIPDSSIVSGAASGSVTGDVNFGNTAAAGHTHTFTATWPAYTSDSHYISDNEYFLPPYFNVVIAEKVNFILRNYIWYEDNDAVTPTQIWGNPDLTFGQSIVTLPVAAGRPPDLGSELRLRVQILINGNNLAANSVRFKLQYNATRSGLCTATTGAWVDVGENSDTAKEWRYASSTPSEQTLPSSVFTSPASNVLGKYIKSQVGSLNNPGATVGDHVEYDFHIENYAATGATQYSFRVMETTGTLLSQYGYPNANTLCPTLTTRPRTENQMRHGNFFNRDPAGDGTDKLENGFSWVD